MAPSATRMVARSVARLTSALSAPGTARKAFSTLPTQEAQVMPEIASAIVVAPGS